MGDSRQIHRMDCYDDYGAGNFYCGAALGIFSFVSKKPIGFWANAEMFQVTDIKNYNAAMGKLYCTMGIMFILLEVPLLSGHNSAWILVSAGGVMIEVIVAMIVYITVIEKKYKKK